MPEEAQRAKCCNCFQFVREKHIMRIYYTLNCTEEHFMKNKQLL